jgi:2-isopropylmalate synthase
MSSDNRIIIFDTTLRDGEQALPQSLSARQKLQIALALEELGVDVLEAGFPISSKGDFESVSQIAATLKKTIPCGLSRCVAKDIEAAGEALRVAERFRIHTFIATSTIHVRDKLRKSFDDIVEMAKASVKLARNYTDDVEFSCEDAGRTPIDELCRMVEAAIDAGATTINIPDTVGYTLPTEFGGIITNIFNRVPNIDKAVLSVHCHNDLGMATANSLTAVQMGARQIECCMNGLGERAGNTSLEEVAAALNVRNGYFEGLKTGIVMKNIARTSSLVAKICHEPVPPHKAIVGSNAFAHSSGIHQDGVLKNVQTYEIIDPHDVGIDDNSIVLTARSGRAALKNRLHVLGVELTQEKLDKIYEEFLKLADKKKDINDDDILVLAGADRTQNHRIKLEYLQVTSGVGVRSVASLGLNISGEKFEAAASGNGPVDAAIKALKKIIDRQMTLKEFTIQAISKGSDDMGKVHMQVEYDNRIYYGFGANTDIIAASVEAYIDCINKFKS